MANIVSFINHCLLESPLKYYLVIILRQGLILSPKLEGNGAISAHCNLQVILVPRPS